MFAIRIRNAYYLRMSKFTKPKPKETVSFRIGEEVEKFLKEELKGKDKNKSRFLEGILWLGITAYKRSKKEIIL
jgi:hypothetical protein